MSGRMGRSRLRLRLPQSGGLPALDEIVFRSDFYDGSTTPQVGSFVYTRSGTLHYPNTNTSISSVGANTLAVPAYRWNGSEDFAGALLHGGIKNFLLHSEDFTDAVWVAVGGGGSSANTATDPKGTSTADTVSGSTAGDGIEQDSGVAAGSDKFVFSVWLKVTSGTRTVQIRLRDNTSAQGAFAECALTTSWERFEVPHKFTSGSGNAFAQIIVGNSSDVRVWGAQLEQFASGLPGRRDREASANGYVSTGAATATVGSGRIEVPNSILTQMATEGSFACWVLPNWSSWQYTGNAPYLFSCNGETFAFSFDVNSGFRFFINGSTAVQTSSTALELVASEDMWQHVAVTWNTDTDNYKIYRDGVLIASSTGAKAAINFSTNTLNLGGYDPTSVFTTLDATVSECIFWKKELDATEVNKAFSNKADSAMRGAPGTGKIFSVALGTSVIPTIGDKKVYTAFNGGLGPIGHYPTPTTFAAADVFSHPAPATPLNGFNKGGMQFLGTTTNEILQSEAITTTWTAVGVPTLTAGVGSLLGAITYGTIDGSATEGIQQSTALTAASKLITCSCFASVASGTLAFQIILEGDTGPSETQTFNFTATTTPQRFFASGTFTGSAAGNVRMKIVLNGTGVLRVGGMMLENASTSGLTMRSKVSSPYIKTTTTTSTMGYNYLYYRASDSINYQKGTILAWGFLVANNTTSMLGNNAPVVAGGPGQSRNFYPRIGVGIQELQYSGLNLNAALTVTPDTWMHLAYTWDATVSPAQFKLFKDGSKLLDTTGSPGEILKHRQLIIGGDYFLKPQDAWQGGLDLVEIWGRPLSDAEVLAEFNATKSDYGL